MKDGSKNGIEGECCMFICENTGKIHQQSNSQSYNGKDNLDIITMKKKLSKMVSKNGIKADQLEMQEDLASDNLHLEDSMQDLRCLVLVDLIKTIYNNN